MDEWGWEHVARWTEHRVKLPIGLLFCILAGTTRGRGWSVTAARGELRRLAVQAGLRRRFAPHQSAAGGAELFAQVFACVLDGVARVGGAP